MHLLVVAQRFPSPEYPYYAPFIGEQVRQLCERVDRITVLSPTAFVPPFMRWVRRGTVLASLPDRYQMQEGRCEVLFPRYIKAPGHLFLRWTTAQWCRIVNQTVARFAKTCPVSIIHAHTGSVSAWAAIYAAQRHHVPCVVTYHGSEVYTILAQRHKGWRLCRDSFRLADLNLPVSRSLESILRRHAQPIGRCETLLLGVDQTRFYPPSEPSAEPHALFVGRVERAKGIFDLLSAWVKVRLACPDASLSIVGEDCTDGLFVRKVRSCGVESSIKLTGPLPNPAIADLMRQSRLFCLPSHGEGTSVCVMEAMSSGLPVVATCVGGIPAVVDHEKTGLLVDTGDIEGLATAIVRLLRDPDRCARMGQVAQAFAREYLDARKTAERLVKLYSTLIAARSKSDR
jgi:glycosyltransferase involved in cell wall biosynthesis